MLMRSRGENRLITANGEEEKPFRTRAECTGVGHSSSEVKIMELFKSHGVYT
jgi:hypothetical protein